MCTGRKQDREPDRFKTPRDFAALAKKNWELALRLFEYQDFIEAPFMQDVQTRTVYEGLKGRNGRNNLLEEFLVALHVKEPVSLKADVSKLVLDAPQTAAENVIQLAASGWGYAEVQVEADGSFLSIEKNAVTTHEFDQDRYQHPVPVSFHSISTGEGTLGQYVLKPYARNSFFL